MWIARIERWIVALGKLVIGIAFMVLIGVVLTQVVGRALGSSPIWTEELTRYALLYMAAIGAGLSLRSGDLVNVDLVYKAVSEVWIRRLRLFSAGATAFMCAVLLAPAWRYVKIGELQTSPAMGLRMNYVHFAAFAMLLILLVFAVLRILTTIFKDNTDSAEKPGDHS